MIAQRGMGELMTAWFPGGASLTAADLAVFAALLAVMIAIGRRAGAATKTNVDYFRAGRGLPWPAAGLALLSAEVSTLTLLGVPAASFTRDWTYPQFFLGAFVARVLVAVWFLPAFFRSRGATPYAYLGRRFGPLTRSAGAAAFLATRLVVASIRLLAMCVAAGALLGWGPWPTLALLTAVSIAALAGGGVRSAVWTGVFQAAGFLAVGALSILFLARRIDGGLITAWNMASDAGKLRIFDGGTPAFWAAVSAGFFGSAAAFGADHELAQKLLAVKDARDACRAMMLSLFGSLLVLFLYMSVGTLLFVFFKQNPGMALPARPDQIFPHFAATAMPRFLRGLVLGAIVLASIDLPLASLATAFVGDLRPAPPGAEPRAPRAAAVVFALLLAVLAVLFGRSDAVRSLAFKAGGVAAGPLLGIFLLGLVSRRRGDLPVVSVFGAMVALNWILLVLSENGLLPISWGQLIPFEAVATCVAAWALLSIVRPRAAPRPAP